MYAEEGRQREVAELAGELYRERRGYLLIIACRHAVSRADAEEALQEAFAAFVRAYDPGRGAPPLAWLTLTMKRECWRKRRDAHLDRRAGQEAERGSEDSGFVMELIPSPGASLEERVMERDVGRRRLARLRPDQRTGLGLLGAGFSYKEISRLRGWTYTKVNRCISEGRAALAAV
jgi:DNA-directed RNA polymerase specialized sigma24 family protein